MGFEISLKASDKKIEPQLVSEFLSNDYLLLGKLPSLWEYVTDNSLVTANQDYNLASFGEKFDDLNNDYFEVVSVAHLKFDLEDILESYKNNQLNEIKDLWETRVGDVDVWDVRVHNIITFLEYLTNLDAVEQPYIYVEMSY